MDYKKELLSAWNKSFNHFLEGQKMKALLTIDTNNTIEEHENENTDIYDYFMSFQLKSGTIDNNQNVSIVFSTNKGDATLNGRFNSDSLWYWAVNIKALTLHSKLDKKFLNETLIHFPLDKFATQYSLPAAKLNKILDIFKNENVPVEDIQ